MDWISFIIINRPWFRFDMFGNEAYFFWKNQRSEISCVNESQFHCRCMQESYLCPSRLTWTQITILHAITLTDKKYVKFHAIRKTRNIHLKNNNARAQLADDTRLLQDFKHCSTDGSSLGSTPSSETILLPGRQEKALVTPAHLKHALIRHKPMLWYTNLFFGILSYISTSSTVSKFLSLYKA